MSNLLSKIKSLFNSSVPFINTGDYWERRYKKNGNSGDGSYGRLAEFKANEINKLLKEFAIHSSIELGCGDGNQLGLIQYPKYTGLDISPTVVDKCKQRYSGDTAKSFLVNNENTIRELKANKPADMTLSLDVIYHLVEVELFEKYLNTLFDLSGKVVAIYSTNFDQIDTAHVVHRKFSDWVEKNRPDWALIRHIKNPYPGVGPQLSNADFYIYTKK